MRQRLLWPCLFLTLAAVAVLPILSRFYYSQQSALPPGIQPRETTLMRIWLVGDMMGADSFLKKQAAAYEKRHPARRLYLRTARPQELADPDALLPDGIIFAPGTLSQPENLLKPLTGAWPVPDRLLMAGKWQGETYALPLLLGGYALGENPKGEGFEAAAGIPLMLASDQPVTETSLPQQKVYENFAAGRSRQAVLTLRQVRSLIAKDHAFRGTALPYGFTDLCLAGGVMGENAAGALAFFQYLLTPEAQQALREYGLFSVDASLTLYDESTPLMAQAEAIFQRESALPSLFAFDPDTARALSLSVHHQRENPKAAFERLQ